MINYKNIFSLHIFNYLIFFIHLHKGYKMNWHNDYKNRTLKNKQQ